MTEVPGANLLGPIALSFVLGAVARLAGSDLRLPRDLYAALSIDLLFALELKGGHELSRAGLAAIERPATGTLLPGPALVQDPALSASTSTAVP